MRLGVPYRRFVYERCTVVSSTSRGIWFDRGYSNRSISAYPKASFKGPAKLCGTCVSPRVRARLFNALGGFRKSVASSMSSNTHTYDKAPTVNEGYAHPKPLHPTPPPQSLMLASPSGWLPPTALARPAWSPVALGAMTTRPISAA